MTKNQLILMMTQIEWVWRWENMYMYKYVPIKPFELWTKSVHSSINKYGNFIIFDDVMTPFDKICHNLWLMFSVLRDDRNHTNLHQRTLSVHQQSMWQILNNAQRRVFKHEPYYINSRCNFLKYDTYHNDFQKIWQNCKKHLTHL